MWPFHSSIRRSVYFSKQKSFFITSKTMRIYRWWLRHIFCGQFNTMQSSLCCSMHANQHEKQRMKHRWLCIKSFRKSRYSYVIPIITITIKWSPSRWTYCIAKRRSILVVKVYSFSTLHSSFRWVVFGKVFCARLISQFYVILQAISAGTSYLIVLLQFDMSFGRDKNI